MTRTANVTYVSNVMAQGISLNYYYYYYYLDTILIQFSNIMVILRISTVAPHLQLFICWCLTNLHCSYG